MSLEGFDFLEMPVLCCFESGSCKAASAKQSKSRYVRSAHEFGDDHCPGGYRWFARWRIGLLVGTWITARNQDRRDLLGKQIARREALYSDFIGESARLLVDAMQHNQIDLQRLLPVYALLSRIRLSSSEPVLQTAEKVIQIIVETHPQPNLTAEQVESRTVNGQDPLAQFSDTCRTELESLQRQL